MMKQSYPCECHSDTVFIAGLNHIVVSNRAAGLGNVFYSALMGALDVVAKRKEGIAAERYLAILRYPIAFLFTCQWGRTGIEKLLPNAFCQHVIVVFADVNVNGIVAIGPSDVGFERQTHHFGMLAEPPNIGFVTCQSCAMDATLLPRSDADSLPVFDVTQ